MQYSMASQEMWLPLERDTFQRENMVFSHLQLALVRIPNWLR